MRHITRLCVFVGLFSITLLEFSACKPGGVPCSRDSECFSSYFCDLERNTCHSRKGLCKPDSRRICYTGAGGTAGVGTCRSGFQICDKGRWGKCQDEKIPSDERCDGLDNNCDGQIDELCASKVTCQAVKLAGKIATAIKLVSPQKIQFTVSFDFKDPNLRWGFIPNVKLLPTSWEITSTAFRSQSTRNTLVLVAETKDSPKKLSNTQFRLQLQLRGEALFVKEHQKRCVVSYKSPLLSLCPVGEHYCGGQCVTLQANPKHCGACGQICSSPRRCTSGTCKCPVGTTFCDGQCVELQNDSKHCGACGDICSLPRKCSDGKCECPPNRAFCDGKCVDLQMDAGHCGACHAACSGFLNTCTKTKCTCPLDKVLCLGQCVATSSLSSDPLNCGACGKRCNTEEKCLRGVCGGCVNTSECKAGSICRDGTCTSCPGSHDCDQVLPFANSSVVIMRAMVLDRKDNLYVGGSFEGHFTLGTLQAVKSKGKTDFFIAKRAAKGGWDWIRSAGGVGDEHLGRLFVQNGSVYAGGMYGKYNSSATFFTNTSTNTKVLPALSGARTALWIAKLSSLGDLQWSLSVGGGGYNWFNMLTVNAAEEISFAFGPQFTVASRALLCGSKNLYNGTDPLDSDTQLALIRIDQQGKCLWGRMAGSQNKNLPTIPFAAELDSQGNSLVFGSFRGPATFGSFTLKGNDLLLSLYLAKVDKKGTFVWAKQLTNPFTKSQNKPFMASDAQGHLYVTVRLSTPVTVGTKTLVPVGEDFFVAKYSPQGNLLWLNHITGESVEQSYAIAIGPKGFVYVSGHFKKTIKFGSHQRTAQGTGDGFILKLEPKAGKIHWFEILTGTGSEAVGSISFDSKGFIYATSTSNSPTTPHGHLNPKATGIPGERQTRIWKLKP